MNTIKIPIILQKFGSIFKENGFSAYLVGGAVRDSIMKKTPSDWDVTTDATPEQVMHIFKRVIPTGIAHGTVTVHFMKQQIEVTTFRTESDYSDGRHPDKVEYTRNLIDDLSRRDFTMNAIAASLETGKIEDPFSGKDDIKKQIIRTVGNPFERFSEDGLRPIRAIRFATQLNFTIEQNTLEAIKDENIKKVSSKISVERFRDEFLKLLKAQKPSDGLKLLEETGLLSIFIPEFTNCRGCIQSDYRGYHEFDVLDHLFYSCDGSPAQKPLVRLAALFHDIGKPEAKEIVSNELGSKITFYNHDFISAEKTKALMTRLKFSNAEIDYVCHLIQNHMFNYESTWSDAAIRRFIVKEKSECIDDLIDLRLADIYGMHNVPIQFKNNPVIDNLLELKDRIKKEENKNSALSLKNLCVNGKDLMSIGIPSGKILGDILNELLETVLDDPKQNSKDILLKIADNIYKSRQ